MIQPLLLKNKLQEVSANTSTFSWVTDYLTDYMRMWEWAELCQDRSSTVMCVSTCKNGDWLQKEEDKSCPSWGWMLMWHNDNRLRPAQRLCWEQHHSWWHLQTERSDRYVFMWLATHWKHLKLWWRGGHASFRPPSAPLTAGSRGPSLTDWWSSTVTRTNTLNLLYLKQLICSLLHTVVIYKFALQTWTLQLAGESSPFSTASQIAKIHLLLKTQRVNIKPIVAARGSVKVIP